MRRLIWPANSISTQNSYAAHPWLLAGSQMDDSIVGNRKKKKKKSLFYLTRHCLFTCRCFVIVAGTGIADYVILSAIFFSLPIHVTD